MTAPLPLSFAVSRLLRKYFNSCAALHHIALAGAWEGHFGPTAKTAAGLCQLTWYLAKMRGYFYPCIPSRCGATEEEEEEVISCRLFVVDQALAAKPCNSRGQQLLPAEQGREQQPKLPLQHLSGVSYLKHEEGAKEAPAVHYSVAPPELRFWGCNSI